MSADEEARVRGKELMCEQCGCTRWKCLTKFDGECCDGCEHPAPTRSGSETRQRTEQVGVRLLPEEAESLAAAATTQGVSPGEVLRNAFFGQCACVPYTIRTDYGTGTEHDVDRSSCPVHGPDQSALAAAVIDVCWRATQYGSTDDGDRYAYLVTKGALHRLVGAAQSAGISAALRDPAYVAAAEAEADVEAERWEEGHTAGVIAYMNRYEPDLSPNERLLRAVELVEAWEHNPYREEGHTVVGTLGADERCNRCDGENVTWAAPSPLWNLVMRGNDINADPLWGDLVCIRCFIVLAAEAGVTGRWRVTVDPEPPGLVYETPSGRTWDAVRWLWVEPDGETLTVEEIPRPPVRPVVDAGIPRLLERLQRSVEAARKAREEER